MDRHPVVAQKDIGTEIAPFLHCPRFGKVIDGKDFVVLPQRPFDRVVPHPVV